MVGIMSLLPSDAGDNVSRRQGHFCWCCGRMKANEGFSGRGHARHVCKDCSRLGPDELAYQQAARDIDRMIQWETGRVTRKQRNNFERFLQHPNERIRHYAEGIAARMTVERRCVPSSIYFESASSTSMPPAS